MVDFRVGIGQDSHAFERRAGKPLMLCNVHIPGAKGVRSNSDGDVALHALCNAISSAIGGRSLATYADEMCKVGVTDSAAYLRHALEGVKKAGWRVANVSIAIECLRPRLEQFVPAMKRRLSQLLSLREDCVGITITSGEGLTSFGKGFGIQSFAAAALRKRQSAGKRRVRVKVERG